MTPVFLDSVGLIALWNERDQWHVAATRAFADLRAKRAAFSREPKPEATLSRSLPSVHFHESAAGVSHWVGTQRSVPSKRFETWTLSRVRSRCHKGAKARRSRPGFRLR